jgi:hypothetical protein
MHRPTSFFGKLLLDDGFDRAVVGAGATANAGVGVDDELVFALGDGLNGAVVGASTALDAGVSNLECHDYVPPYVFLIPDTAMAKNILAWISENAIPILDFVVYFFCLQGKISGIGRDVYGLQAGCG